MKISEVMNQAQEYCDDLELKKCPICQKKVYINVYFSMAYELNLGCSCGLRINSVILHFSDYPDALDMVDALKKNADSMVSKWNSMKCEE